MAAFESGRAAPFGAITAYRIVNVVYATIDALRVWNEKRITRTQLYKLSERELDDIGLTRADIEGVIARHR